MSPNEKKAVPEGFGDWRARIDVVDQVLIDLINRRLGYALEIGEIKRKNDLPVRDQAREDALLAKLKEYNNGPLGADALEDIFKRIIQEARDLEAR
jgi:chorismate mutase